MSFFSKLFGGRQEVAQHAEPMDLVVFAERYAQALRAAWPEAEVAISHGAGAADARIDWRLPDGFQATHFLGNSYQRYLDAPDQPEAVFAEQIASARELQLGVGRGSDAAGTRSRCSRPVRWACATRCRSSSSRWPATWS